MNISIPKTENTNVELAWDHRSASYMFWSFEVLTIPNTEKSQSLIVWLKTFLWNSLSKHVKIANLLVFFDHQKVSAIPRILCSTCVRALAFHLMNWSQLSAQYTPRTLLFEFWLNKVGSGKKLPKLLKWCFKVSWGGKMTATQSSTTTLSMKRLKE